MITRTFLASLYLLGLISVASYLLLNHRLQLRKDLQDLKPWTAVLRRQNIPSQKSQVDGSQLSKKVNKKDPDAPNTSTPPHPKPPLSQSAKMKNVLERLGIDKENSAHRSLQVRPHIFSSNFLLTYKTDSC
jgi:hypothetical protein